MFVSFYIKRSIKYFIENRFFFRFRENYFISIFNNIKKFVNIKISEWKLFFKHFHSFKNKLLSDQRSPFLITLYRTIMVSSFWFGDKDQMRISILSEGLTPGGDGFWILEVTVWATILSAILLYSYLLASLI